MQTTRRSTPWARSIRSIRPCRPRRRRSRRWRRWRRRRRRPRQSRSGLASWRPNYPWRRRRAERASLTTRVALTLQLGHQQLGVQRRDQVVQRLRAVLDHLHRAAGVHLAREAVEQDLDLLLHEVLERALVAQRVVDREADPLVVAAGAKARDRLHDPRTRRRVAAARRR